MLPRPVLIGLILLGVATLFTELLMSAILFKREPYDLYDWEHVTQCLGDEQNETYLKHLAEEAPETLKAPNREAFSDDEFYLKAFAKYKINGNWATPSLENTSRRAVDCLNELKR